MRQQPAQQQDGCFDDRQRMDGPSKDVTILICSHRAPATLYNALQSVVNQSPLSCAEVILVNNGFSEHDEHSIRSFMNSHGPDVDFRMVREARPAVGFARRRGFGIAAGRYLVQMDDDNTLGPDFLSTLLQIIRRYPDVGGICPIVEAVWEQTPEDWLKNFGQWCLSYNAADGYRPAFSERYWPPEEAHAAMLPPGGGMIIHHRVAGNYLERVRDPRRIALSRQPNSLAGCEDVDIFSGVTRLGMGAFFSDRLKVYHHIPRSRTLFSYLVRLNYQQCYSAGVMSRLEAPATGRVSMLDLFRLAKQAAHLAMDCLRGRKNIKRCTLEIARALGGMAGRLNLSSVFHGLAW